MGAHSLQLAYILDDLVFEATFHVQGVFITRIDQTLRMIAHPRI